MRFFLRKLFSLSVTLWIIVTLTFFLMKALPGDPFMQEQALPKEIHEALRSHYGLDDPLYLQYTRYLKSVLQWDFGPSFKHPGRSVNAMIRDGSPVSIILGIEVLVISIVAGVTLGALAALNHRHWHDGVAMVVATAGISVPSFIFATLLQYFFAVKMGWFPVARWGTFAQTILPALSLAALPTAFIARITRANLLTTLRQGFIKTAYAKGISRWGILTKHALTNALPPLLPYMGQLVTGVLMGSFIVEKIFAIPGLGYVFVSSIANRDYTVIMGATVYYSTVLLTLIFVMDILYGICDPRVRGEI